MDIFNELCQSDVDAAYARVVAIDREPMLVSRCDAVYKAADGDEVALQDIGAALGISYGESKLPRVIREDLAALADFVAETVYAE